MKLKIPKRTESPRKSGLTIILKKGLPINLFADYIKSYHSLIDIIKFTSGMGLVDTRIDEKIYHNVNLGNIPLSDVNMLEVQRLGIRYETFHIFDDK